MHVFPKAYLHPLAVSLAWGALALLLQRPRLCLAQSPPTGRASSPRTPDALSALPKSCQWPAKNRRQVTELLAVLSARPSAEGYNALGALYAQQEVSCAIAAFRESLRLDSASWETRYNLALALQSQGQYREAARELRTVIRQKPDSFAAQNALGLVLRALREPDEAREAFRAALKINPKFAHASLNLAELDLEQKRYSAAIYYLRQGLEASPPRELASQLEMDLAVAYSQIGDYGKAAPLFRKLLSLQPNSALLHFNLATVYAHGEQYAEAADEYRKALQLDPGDERARLSLAKALLILNQAGEAVPHLLKHTQDKPADPEGYELLGQAYRKLGRNEEAVTALRRAVDMNPRSYDARYNLGSSLARLGKTDEAIVQLEEATRLKPNSSEAFYELGLLLAKRKGQQAADKEFQAFQQIKRKDASETRAGVLNRQANQFLEEGRTQAAADSYRQALELMPDNARLHYNLSLALSKLGDHAGEQGELEAATRLDTRLAEAHNQLGIIYMAQDRTAEAEREFKAAVDANPQYAEAQSNLGTLYGREGKDADALALFRQAIANNPQYAQAYLNLGLVLAAQGHYTQAEEQFQQAINISPDNADAYTALGMAEVKRGRVKEAVPIFQKVMALKPDSPDARVNLGIALADSYDLNGAIEQFSEAIRLAPDSSLAHYNKGRALYDGGKRSDARAELEVACRNSPNYTAGLYLLAMLERQANNLPRSTELLKRIIAVEPRNADARYALGESLLRVGREGEAIQHWRLAVESDPNNSQALYHLAQVLTKAGKPEGKLYRERFEALQKARQLTDRVQQLGNFGLEAANARNWPLAVEQLKEALELCGQCPQSAQLHRNLGLIYCRTGNTAEGERELRAALKLHPTDEDAQKALEILQNFRKKQLNSNLLGANQ